MNNASAANQESMFALKSFELQEGIFARQP
jgi:hypothetical protein